MHTRAFVADTPDMHIDLAHKNNGNKPTNPEQNRNEPISSKGELKNI